MNRLNYYIQEKLKISAKSSVNQYTYTPENKKELIEILKELIEKRGNNADLNDIDVSKIDDMTQLFVGLQNIENIDISAWDVSNVKTFKTMFWHCRKFNCDLSKWNVSNAESFANMFEGCHEFNSELGTWNLSKAKTLMHMFDDCSSFEGKGLENWDVSNVDSLYGTFNECKKFNCDVSKWNVSKVKYLSSCFQNCEILDCDFSKWNVTTDKMYMKGTFSGCKKLIRDRKLPNWWPYKNLIYG